MAEPTTYIDFCYEPTIRWTVMAASFDRFDDEPNPEVSCLIIYDPTGFGHRLAEGIVVRSVASHAGVFWVVGKDGEVWTYPAGQKVPIKDRLPDAGVRTKRHLGPPKRVRAIAGVPYVCGYAGQIYTLARNRWVHMDAGIVEPEGTVKSIQLEGLHGTAADDLYVSGSGGLLARFDGRSWTRIPLATKSFLGSVRAFSRTHVAAVGNNGTFVEWDGRNWSVDQVPGCEQTAFADLEMFNDEIYVASEERLMVRRGNKWSAVKTGLKEDPEFLRLTLGEGRLWAMGFKRIHSFDGRKWEAYVNPDNG
jgi:hypothetical protein